MRRLTALLALLLTACAGPADVPATGFRDRAVPIYSNAVTAPDRLAGDWLQLAEFADAEAPPCAGGALRVTAASPGRIGLSGALCRNGQREPLDGPATVSGPGRLRPAGADPEGLGAEWWLLWVDADLRTLVIGTPAGQFGMILNRDPVLPPDRAAAARDILAWAGYDLRRLRPVTPAP